MEARLPAHRQRGERSGRARRTRLLAQARGDHAGGLAQWRSRGRLAENQGAVLIQDGALPGKLHAVSSKILVLSVAAGAGHVRAADAVVAAARAAQPALD